MSLLHGDVEGFADGVSDRVMWGLFYRPDRAWILGEIHPTEGLATEQAGQYNCPTIIQAVKVRVDMRGVQ